MFQKILDISLLISAQYVVNSRKLINNLYVLFPTAWSIQEYNVCCRVLRLIRESYEILCSILWSKFIFESLWLLLLIFFLTIAYTVMSFVHMRNIVNYTYLHKTPTNPTINLYCFSLFINYKYKIWLKHNLIF